MEDNIFEKLPNWLRYILAIPFGIICWLIGYYIGYWSNLWIASPDSLMIKFYTYIYNNGINVFVFIFCMNYMLPKRQFEFTLFISILYGGVGFVGLGISILMGTVTLKYIIGLILSFSALIYSCYLTYKTLSNISNLLNDKYIQLSTIVMQGINITNINEAIDKVYNFYKEEGIAVDRITPKENKQQYLSEIVMLALNTTDIDEAISKARQFYEEQNQQEEVQ